MKRIYEVIKILDKKTILINYGANDNAQIGEKVRIFEAGEEVVVDDFSYGTLNLIKEELEIVRVYKMFSMCQKIEEKKTNPYQVLDLSRTMKKVVELNVDESQVEELRYKTNNPIRVKDLVEVL